MTNRWVVGARPRTLPAAVVPVLVGTACAVGETDDGIVWWRFLAALVAAVAIQVGTNYVNDYADGKRGTDDRRVGPVRLVASGLATADQVKLAALVSALVAAVAGIALSIAVGPELLLVGAASFAAGFLYTGGPRPYGYAGLGEVFVFLFFGVVAVAGSYFAQVESLSAAALLLAIPVGLLASAILVVNNVRDLETDRRAGKRTLAVRMGRERSRALYAAMLAGAFVTAPLPWVLGSDSLDAWLLLVLLAVPLAVPLVRTVRTRVDGPSLNGALAGTGQLQLAFCVLLSAGILAS